jgi:hypothetical protein
MDTNPNAQSGIPNSLPPIQPIGKPASRFPTGPFLGILAAVVIVGGSVLAYFQYQQQQEVRSQASEVQWTTAQSASAACTASGIAAITATFTNTETSSSKAMKVIVKDNQTGKSVDMGTVNARQTKTTTIDTGRTSLSSNKVTFNLSWANGSSGTDSRTASYPAVSTCPMPTKIPTPTISKSPTPTTTACPTPGIVKNIKITCPYCSPTPSSGQ